MDVERAAPRPNCLLDRLGERLALAWVGVRLWDAAVRKLEELGEQAPASNRTEGATRDELVRLRDEESAHLVRLRALVAARGGDPATRTPAADVAMLASRGPLDIADDPRSPLRSVLEAILVAELADDEGWELLITIAEEIEDPEVSAVARHARSQEQEHLAKLREWIADHALDEVRSRRGTVRPAPEG